MTPATRDEHWVYVIHSPQCRTFKIGRSATERGAAERIKTHQTSSGEPLDLLGVFNSRHFGSEKHLHEVFSEYRKHGEWFAVTDDSVGILQAKLGITISGNATAPGKEKFPVIVDGHHWCDTLTPSFDVVVDLVRNPGHQRQGPMFAYYEVWLDPMTDDYLLEDISAHELYRQWSKKARAKWEKYVPIFWYVDGPGLFESHPYYSHDLCDEYDKHFTEPERLDGQSFDWDDLAIVRKRWATGERIKKGGFIEQVTGGWRPDPHQMWADIDQLDRLVNA